jgi:hypothetical protein
MLLFVRFDVVAKVVAVKGVLKGGFGAARF